MSSFLDEIASKIAADVAGLEFDNAAGRNVFVGVIPASPDKAVAIMGLPGTNIQDHRDIAELHFPRFQIITRSDDYEEAATLFEDVRTSLHGLIAHDLPTWHIMRCHVEQEGGPLGQDGEGRFEFSTNYISEYYKIPES